MREEVTIATTVVSASKVRAQNANPPHSRTLFSLGVLDTQTMRLLRILHRAYDHSLLSSLSERFSNFLATAVSTTL